jgi:hypothetical protein
MMIELPGKKGVIPNNALVVGRGDEGPCCVPTLVLPGIAHEPPVE